jgi:hypothetical protein
MMDGNQSKKRQPIWAEFMYAAIFCLLFIFFYIRQTCDVKTFEMWAFFLYGIISSAIYFHADWQIRYEKENNEFFHLDRRRVVTLYGSKWLGAVCSVVFAFLFLLRLLGLS